MKPRVLVFRHVRHEGLGTIAAALGRARIDAHLIDTPGRARLPDPAPFAGLIVMGGPMGVYEKSRYPFLKKELKVLRQALIAGKPILGICLGAQLLAHALGARVFPNRHKEIGWFRIHRTARGRQDPLFRLTPARPTVFQWHGDTFDLPPGARRLATAPVCRNQAFAFAHNVYGLQYHLEVDAAMVTDWLAQPGAEAELAGLSPRGRKDLDRRLTIRTRQLKRDAVRFLDGFARLCATPVSPGSKKG